MTREEAIKYFENGINTNLHLKEKDRFAVGIANENIEAYSMAISALSENKGAWIPCSERLPEEVGTYLVTLEYKEHGTGITTLWFHGSLGWDLRVADVVTAWMPLPEPYKAENEVKPNE